MLVVILYNHRREWGIGMEGEGQEYIPIELKSSQRESRGDDTAVAYLSVSIREHKLRRWDGRYQKYIE